MLAEAFPNFMLTRFARSIALCFAAYRNHKPIIEFLIESGVYEWAIKMGINIAPKKSHKDISHFLRSAKMVSQWPYE